MTLAHDAANRTATGLPIAGLPNESVPQPVTGIYHKRKPTENQRNHAKKHAFQQQKSQILTDSREWVTFAKEHNETAGMEIELTKDEKSPF